MQPSPLNEKVLKDKRRKLKQTLDRVLKMYVSIVCIVSFIKLICSQIHNIRFIYY